MNYFSSYGDVVSNYDDIIDPSGGSLDVLNTEIARLKSMLDSINEIRFSRCPLNFPSFFKEPVRNVHGNLIEIDENGHFKQVEHTNFFDNTILP